MQRLGFEPPPVSEEKRLTGELDEIESRTTVDEIQAEQSDQVLFAQVFGLVNQGEGFDGQTRQLVSRAKDRMLALAETRPALVRQAATLERIVVQESLQLNDCEGCIESLKVKLWQLVEAPVSLPVRGQQNWFDADPLIQSYRTQQEGAQ